MKNTQTGESIKAGISPELVARARTGDQAAFAELYRQTSAELYRSVRAMVRDEDLAWDILQDSYLRAFRGLDKLQTNEAFLPWLRRIAVNVTATKMARRQPLSFSELAGGDEEDREAEIPDLRIDSQPELALDRKESARLVREILSSLPEAQQMILGMHYYEDMPIREIAETLHVAPGTVKAQLYKGRKKIEALVRGLEQQGVKLYGLGPLPFLVALLRNLAPAQEAEQKALTAVLSKAASNAAAGGAAAAGEAAVNVSALTAGQAFLHGLGAKLLAGALALALLAGGGKLVYDALKKGELPWIGPVRPTAEETANLAETGEPTAEEDRERYVIPANACGPDLTWNYDENTGALTIEGSGEMYNFAYISFDESNQPPWYGFRERITSVALPEGLSSIGEYAFCDCTGLISVAIPEGVSSVRGCAFRGCSGLRSVSIPESVSSVSGDAFILCTSLEAVSVHPANTHYRADENGVLYDKEQDVLITCPRTMRGAFVVPESVSTIGYDAFCDCTGLTSVTLPKGLVFIETDAFCNCRGLTSVTIPNSVTRIEGAAFTGCTGLTSITFPESVTYIGESAFCGCTGLVYATIPENVTTISYQAFAYCSLTIRGVPGSEAERYAEENDIPFVVIEP